MVFGSVNGGPSNRSTVPLRTRCPDECAAPVTIASGTGRGVIVTGGAFPGAMRTFPAAAMLAVFG